MFTAAVNHGEGGGCIPDVITLKPVSVVALPLGGDFRVARQRGLDAATVPEDPRPEAPKMEGNTLDDAFDFDVYEDAAKQHDIRLRERSSLAVERYYTTRGHKLRF